jgi:hypothetical protein
MDRIGALPMMPMRETFFGHYWADVVKTQRRHTSDVTRITIAAVFAALPAGRGRKLWSRAGRHNAPR